ncbi:MAG: proteasome activator [Actinomycetota bacterium]
MLPPGTDGDGPTGPTPQIPEIIDAPGADAVPAGEQVSRPTKLIRIASMVRALLEEARHAPLDEAGRRSLKEIHERSIHELEEILSDDLRNELDEVKLSFTSDAPSESELRIAQAQLVGWLEGLFHGIQATLFTQQMQAQRQFEEMRQRRALDAGPDRPSGAYL